MARSAPCADSGGAFVTAFSIPSTPANASAVPPPDTSSLSRAGRVCTAGSDDVAARLVAPARVRDPRNIRQDERLDRGRRRRPELPDGPVAPIALRRRGVAEEAHAQPVGAAGVELVAPFELTDEGSIAQVHVDEARARDARRRPDHLVRGVADFPVGADVAFARRAGEGPCDHVNVEGIDLLAVLRGLRDHGRGDGRDRRTGLMDADAGQRAGDQDDEEDAFQDRGILCRDVVTSSCLQRFAGSALDPVRTRPGSFPVTAPSAQTSSPLT